MKINAVVLEANTVYRFTKRNLCHYCFF